MDVLIHSLKPLTERWHREPFAGADRTCMPAGQDLMRFEDSAHRRSSPPGDPWPDITRFDEQASEYERLHTEAAADSGRLEHALATAADRHADDLAEWQLQGREGPRPESDAPVLQAELEQRQADAAGYLRAAAATLAAKTKYVAASREKLTGDAAARTDAAYIRVRRAIGELADARRELAEAHQSGLWAALYPAAEAAARNPRVGRLCAGLAKPMRQTLGVDFAIEYDRVIQALHADADAVRDAATLEQRMRLNGRDPQQRETDAVWTGAPEDRPRVQAERQALREAAAQQGIGEYTAPWEVWPR